MELEDELWSDFVEQYGENQEPAKMKVYETQPSTNASFESVAEPETSNLQTCADAAAVEQVAVDETASNEAPTPTQPDISTRFFQQIGKTSTGARSEDEGVSDSNDNSGTNNNSHCQ